MSTDSVRKYTEQEVLEAEAVRMPFGKFQGSTLGAIFGREPLYLDWLSKELLLMSRGGAGRERGHPELRAAVGVLVEHHAGVIARVKTFKESRAKGKGELFS